MKNRIRFISALLGVLVLGAGTAFGQVTIASDNGSNSPYNGTTWTDGSNGGSGFGTWSQGLTGDGGRYVGTTGQGANSFGLYAENSGVSTASRSFSSGDLLPGQKFSIDLGHTANVVTGAEVGINLQDDGSTVLTLKFIGGGSNWQLNDGGSDFSAGQAYSANTSISFIFTYEGNNKYTYSFGSGSGSSFTATNTISGINGFQLFNNNQGGGENFGANNLSIDGGAVRILGSAGWRILSSPTSDNTYNNLLGNIWTQGMTGSDSPSNGTANVQDYNGTSFNAISDLATTMTAGKGFITYVYSDDDFDGSAEGFPKTLSLSGTENSGTVTPTLNSGADAWTLVGNPYASTIDWDNLTKTDLTGTVYVYDHSYGTPSGDDVAASGSAGSYRVWNGTTGSLSGGLITPFQGFWVQNSASATSEALSIEEADKATGGTFYKSTSANPNMKLMAKMGTLQNDTYFSFMNNGSVNKDNFDGLELAPLDFVDFLSLSTVVNEEKLSINNLPLDLTEAVEIPVSVEAFTASGDAWVAKGGEVTISWPELKDIPAEWSVILTDFETGMTTDLKESESYTFSLEAVKGKLKPKTNFSVLSPIDVTREKSVNSSSRFGLTISPSTTVSNDEEIASVESFKLEQNYPNPFNPSTTIKYAVGENGPVNIAVYNVMGQKVAELLNTTKTAGNYQVTWNAAGVSSGIYYYRLTAPGQVLTRQMTLIK